MLVACLIN